MAKKNKYRRVTDEAYLKAYYDNEENANKHMSFANAFGGVIMLVIWICYLTGTFEIHDNMRLLINIVFPIGIVILFSPLLYALKFQSKLREKQYKYFVVFSFVFVIAVLNVVIPKHTMIAWALCIIMTNHYYNPRLGKVTFILVLCLLPACMYAGMFLGEYDPNLIGNGVILGDKIVYVDGPVARYNLLQDYLAQGENRYLKVFIYYALPRAAILLLIFFISNALNKRTFKLFVSEIKVNSEQQKTKTELEVAKDIQLKTLPKEFVTNSDIEIQAELKAAKEIGGDFYDYFVLDDDHTAIVIGDVSGKGIPAAMFMMKTITCFKNFVSLDKKPSEILNLVNKTIYEGNDSQMFVTCFLAIINTRTGHVDFANAGHNPPIVGSAKNYHYLDCKSGFILGGMPTAFVTDEQTTLEKGETITLYTDGITEARNRNGEFFGEKRLINLFNKKEYSCLIELHHELKESILEFARHAEQSDDMTYLTLKYHGDKCIYTDNLFPGKQENIPEMLNFLKTFAEEENIDKKFISNLLIVGDELFSNIIKYGYAEKEGDVYIRILYNLDKKELNLTIVDEGTRFNPFINEGKPLEGDIENRKEGGLGILIVKKLMSEYAYDRINHKNIINLKKCL